MRLMQHFSGALAVLFLTASAPPGLAASGGEPVGTDYTEAALLAERPALIPGQEARLALRLKHRQHWHSYWKNPGDSGLATEIIWTLPDGFAAGEIDWPAPHRLPVGPLVNHGYEGEFVLPVRVQVPASLSPGQRVRLQAQANWLVCEKICIPEEAAFSLDLPVIAPSDAAGNDPDPRWIELFRAADQARPKPTPWRATLTSSADRFTIHLAGIQMDAVDADAIHFFAEDGNAVRHAAPQQVRHEAGGLRLDVERGIDKGKPLAGPLAGVLTMRERLADGGTVRQAFALNLAPAVAATAQSTTADPVGVGLAQALLFALLGGLILNLMPCVFPVLFVKALALTQMAHGARAEMRRQGFAYGAGVLATFAVLAAVLLALRASGAAIGWGYQLQNPVVVSLLALLMLAVALNFAGLVELRIGSDAGERLTRQGGLGGAFFTGTLAVVVAAPCTAPFMAAALGFAIAAPPLASLSIFLALGVGMAAPFVLFSCFPALGRLIPRPGPWMTQFRQFLAFPMLATALWLVWVVLRQAGERAAMATLAAGLLLALGAWLFGIAGAGGRRRAVSGSLAALAILAALGLPVYAIATAPAAAPAGAALPAAGAISWSPFDRERVNAARRDGRPVLVNLTAAWCITCLVNDTAVLSSARIGEAIRDANVLPLKGDWTNRDAAITRYLAEFGRAGVPLYVLYPAAPQAAPIVLPQLLTEAMVLEVLRQL